MNVQNDIQKRWWTLEAKLVDRFGKKPDLESVLFLIGVQELAHLNKKKFTKEQKQDLMHVAVCKLLLSSGYYSFEGMDKDNWPVYKQLKPMPAMNAFEQEAFIKDHVLLYFEEIDF